MIALLRRIRKGLLSSNKFGKYMVYAIGEIILVVIGILIAISLNNSNQQKRQQESVDSQLRLLKQSVYQDSLSFEGLIKYTGRQIKDAQRLIQLINQPLSKEDCNEFINLFNQHLEVRTVIADRSIYDEMVNSGAFSKISDQNVKTQIANYYQLAEHFDEIIWIHVKDFREFNNGISMDGTIAHSYFDANSLYSTQEKCNYIKSLNKDSGRKNILENYFYSGIDTYQQINVLYSFLINRLLTGLPDNQE